MSDSLHLTFATVEGTDPHQFEWRIRSTPLARRWVATMKEALNCSFRIREQRFCGWATEPRDIELLASSINDAILVINTHFGERYQIAERANSVMSQSALNLLHHHFELLIGQSWRPSEFLKQIPNEVLVAIRQLNDQVHNYESAVAVNRAAEVGTHPVRFFQAHLAPFPPIELTAEELASFSFACEPGDLTTSYCQLGKTWEEVYYDRDQHVSFENISPLRYLSSTFACWFTSVPPPVALQKRKEVQQFLMATAAKNGLETDPEDPRHALGHGLYASLSEDSPLLRFSETERIAFMREHSNIAEIRFVVGGRQVKRSFPDPHSYLGRDTILPRVFDEIVSPRMGQGRGTSGVKFGEEMRPKKNRA
jgi:hypothetical protein